MPRQARKHAESGIYHVILRGVNQQQIFKEEEDDQKFLQILKDCKEISGYKLLAYCLMGNHIHLLIKGNYSVACHSEPVTDVTGVGIRTPQHGYYGLPRPVCELVSQ